jgi:hypothetical protein
LNIKFEKIMSGPVSLGGTSTDRPAAGVKQYIHADSIPLFIPTDPPLPRGKFAQAVIDVVALVFGLLFLVSLAASIPVAMFLLFFCQF